MTLCHTSATLDEVNYNKNLRKLEQALRDTPNDQRLQRLRQLFEGQSIIESRKIQRPMVMRESMTDAVKFAISSKRETIVFDLIEYAHTSMMLLKITKKELKLLIKDEMYRVIEDLVNSNT